MPDRNSLPDLSKAEHDILNALWRSGAQSVREVHDQVSQTTGWAYTTTKTVMDRMAANGSPWWGKTSLSPARGA